MSYDYQFNYIYDLNGEPYPGLVLRISLPHHPEQTLDIDAYFDSGTQRSLLDGQLGRAMGLDLLSGRPIRYTSVTGSGIDARLHRIQLSHPDLGNFELEIGFSIGQISRNLLGRDFFNLIQIGFREQHLTFYVTPNP